MKFQSLRGFNDVLPADTPAWQHLFAVARETFAAYGYQEIILPVLESTELFKRSIGETTDVVEKEMFTFQDRDGASLTLRPEFTAGVVRAGLEHGLLHNQQQRVWSAGPVFRHERPQAGRYRQFHQLNVEAYGIAGPDIDVEIIALAARFLRRLGLSRVALELNTLGSAETRRQYRAALVTHLERHESDLDPDSRRRLRTNPLRVLDSKVDKTREIVATAPRITDFLDAPSRAHFDGLQQGLSDAGVPFSINPLIVRGLDYYTGDVFEWTTGELGAQGTVLAGGRYDNLVQTIGGAATPATGWACGVERLVLLMQAQGVKAPDAGAHAYFCALDDAAGREALKLAERLREERPALRLVLNAGGGKLAAQLKRADRSGARFALILGEQEAAKQVVQVKSLRDSSPPIECAWSEVSGRLAGLLHLE